MADTVREKFLAERPTFIGGSEVADAVGIGYGCPRRLFLRKTGVEPLAPFHGNNATERGTFLEEPAARLYSLRTGRKIRRPPGSAEMVATRDKEFPFMACHSDFDLVGTSEREPGILSVKVPSIRVFMEARREQAPKPDYMLQLNYEMSIRRRRHGAFAMANFELFDVIAFDFEYDEALAQQSRSAVKLAWEAIQAGGPEPPKLDIDDKRCARCEYRVNCHFSELMEQAGQPVQRGDLEVDVTLASLVQDLHERKQLVKDAEALEDEGEAQLLEALHGREAVEVPQDGFAWRVYNRAQKGRTTFQYKPFAAAIEESARGAAELAAWLRRQDESPNEMTDAEIAAAKANVLAVVEAQATLPALVRQYVSIGAPSRPLKIVKTGAKGELPGGREPKAISDGSIENLNRRGAGCWEETTAADHRGGKALTAGSEE